MFLRLAKFIPVAVHSDSTNLYNITLSQSITKFLQLLQLYTHTHTHTHTSTHTHTQARTHTHIHTCIYNTHTHIHGTHIHAQSMHVCALKTKKIQVPHFSLQ